MKKILIILTCVFTITTLNAKWFIGGELSLDINKISENKKYAYSGDSSISTAIGFMIAPKTGYYFNDKFALGLNFSFGYGSTVKKQNENPKHSDYNVRWGVYPIVRYSAFTYKKFSLLLEGKTGVGGSHLFLNVGGDTERETNDIIISVLNIRPVLCFNLTDHFQLEAGLNVLGAGYDINISEDNSNATNYKGRFVQHRFSTFFNSSNLLNVGGLTIGMIYKF